MRRRKAAIAARERWITGASAYAARAINSQAGMALITPRIARIIDLLELGPGKRYLDVGCGTAAYADAIAHKAGLEESPVTVDIAGGLGPVEIVGWPEKLPFRDQSFDCITSLYFLHRFDGIAKRQTHAFCFRYLCCLTRQCRHDSARQRMRKQFTVRHTQERRQRVDGCVDDQLAPHERPRI